MKILQAVKKIPGGLMVVPLLLGVIANTFSGNALRSMFDGTFTTYLWKSGATSTLAVLIFYNTTTVNLRKAGVTIYKGAIVMAVKVGTDIIIGLICGTLFGEKGFLGPSILAVIDALVNSNGGLYTALAGECGDATDAGMVSILSINDDPFFTMVVLGAVGIVKIPMLILIGCIVPVIMGYILGNLDEDIHEFREPGVTMLTLFFALPLGAEPNIMNLLKAGGPGILLGVACALVTGSGGYLIYKLLCMEYPEVDGTIGTMVNNAVATPASIVAMDVTLLAVAEAVTAQITVVITMTAILYPIFVSYLHKVEARKRGR